MSFEKKIIILSQISEGFSVGKNRASGILRIENEEGVSTLFLSTVNFKFDSYGEYFLFLSFNGKTYSFPLGKKPSSYTFFIDAFIDVNYPLSCGIVFYKDAIPEIVAFAGDKNDDGLSKFKKNVYEKFLAELKKRNSNEKEEFPHFPNHPNFPLPKPFPNDGSPNFPNIDPLNPNFKKIDYDDEVVATENYYELDEDLSEKLKIIENLTKNVSTENGVPNIFGQEETQKNENQSNFNQNEGTRKESQKPEKFGIENPFYFNQKSRT